MGKRALEIFFTRSSQLDLMTTDGTMWFLCALPVIYSALMPALASVDVIGGSVPIVHPTDSTNNPIPGVPSISNFIASPSGSGLMANLGAPAIFYMWQHAAPEPYRMWERASLYAFTICWVLFLATPFTASPTWHGIWVALMGLTVIMRDSYVLLSDWNGHLFAKTLFVVGACLAIAIVVTGAVSECPCSFTYPAEIVTFACFFLFPPAFGDTRRWTVTATGSDTL